PWEIFDMIGGTSTGGYELLFDCNMLGSLRLSIDECLKCYEELADKIFAPKLKSKGALKWINAEAGGMWFNGKDLKNSIKHLLRRLSLDSDIPFRQDEEQECKVQVMNKFSAANESNRIRTRCLFHTDTVGQQNYECSIWEAARATSAAPPYFGPVTFRGANAATFVDGAVRANNPINLVMRDARNVWSTQIIGCVLSIGTGKVHIKGLIEKNAKLHDIVKTMVKMASDAEATARSFKMSEKELAAAGIYHRFNVEHGMGEVELSDTSKVQHERFYGAVLGR
ncbi:FabD/lysophospholipase-like protein, partial [Bimuria novae-zelandiae CBS 107.79]